MLEDRGAGRLARRRRSARVRALIKQADPEVVEEWKWRGVPVWSHAGIICTGETYKAVGEADLRQGRRAGRPVGLFNSSLDGNTRRAIDIREGEAIDEAALQALIRAAAALNLVGALPLPEETEERLKGVAIQRHRPPLMAMSPAQGRGLTTTGYRIHTTHPHPHWALLVALRLRDTFQNSNTIIESVAKQSMQPLVRDDGLLRRLRLLAMTARNGRCEKRRPQSGQRQSDLRARRRCRRSMCECRSHDGKGWESRSQRPSILLHDLPVGVLADHLAVAKGVEVATPWTSYLRHPRGWCL